MGISVKRIYERREKKDGFRILVDRLWPRGLSKERAAIDEWCKELAPSPRLRMWFNHDPAKWQEFKRRYFRELDRRQTAWAPLVRRKRHETVTLLYGSKEDRLNNAHALKEYLRPKL